MAEIGRLFEDGECYVPEMMVSARALKSGLAKLKPSLTQTDTQSAGKVALGTVTGDLHDMGKNLVGMMLEGAGFTVKDLGVDVSPEAFVAVADEVDVIGMSALLTTTMGHLKEALDALEEAGKRAKVKVIVGGAPGYCTNRNDLERHNLWRDEIAQRAFVYPGETFARRYRAVPGRLLSFNLINEPPCPGDGGVKCENHAALIRRTVAAIGLIDPQREIMIDGLGGGYLAMPELADLGVIHSGRGYHPMPITHHRASWWDGAALRDPYRSWRQVEERGVRVHIGEFGCFKHTPSEIAMR